MEPEIIQGCRQNDKNSQKRLFDAYGIKMMSVCTRYSQNTDEAREIFQDGFKQIYADIIAYDHKVDFDEWMREKMVKAVINYYHSKKKGHWIVSTVDARRQPLKIGVEADVNEVIPYMNQKLLLKAMQDLSPAYRTAINMHTIDGFSLKKIADLMGTSEETAKANIEKAHYTLVRVLSQMINSQI